MASEGPVANTAVPKPTILFSGRFDPVHIDHIKTLQQLGRDYQQVKVVLLDHPEQLYPIKDRLADLEYILENSFGFYDISVNKTNFGRITLDEIEKYRPFDFFGSGNFDVLKHVSELGIPSKFVKRSGRRSAGRERASDYLIRAFEVLGSDNNQSK